MSVCLSVSHVLWQDGDGVDDFLSFEEAGEQQGPEVAAGCMSVAAVDASEILVDGIRAIQIVTHQSMEGQGSQRGVGRGGRGAGSSAPVLAAAAPTKASPSYKWCKDWQEWVAQNVDDCPTSFNAVGDAAKECEDRLAQHKSVKAVAS